MKEVTRNYVKEVIDGLIEDVVLEMREASVNEARDFNSLAAIVNAKLNTSQVLLHLREARKLL